MKKKSLLTLLISTAHKQITNKEASVQFSSTHLKVEQLLQLSDSLLRAGHAVANGARVLEDLVVVAALVGLVAEEVDGAVLDAADLLLGFDVLQAVGLVPASGEDVKGDLAADGVAVKNVLLAGASSLWWTSWLTAVAQEGLPKHT